MGLDTTHGCWNGPYSAFHRWRTELARLAGYGHQWPDALIVRNDENPDDMAEGIWKNIPGDPLMILLLHSDCDGHIKPEHAILIADRLDQIIFKLNPVHEEYFISRTKQFAAGLREAAKLNEQVEFY